MLMEDLGVHGVMPDIISGMSKGQVLIGAREVRLSVA